MPDQPFFSVVMATHGRGEHIKPTIESVLGQKFGDFELIVVGDGCVDNTEIAVRSFSSERIIWRNLPRNTGSQSFPNNEGIRACRGRWIAYIGHDDIWAPNHLERIFRTIAENETLDFVISGCVFYGPEGSDETYVTGLFDDADAPFRHFFPPTSMSHRRDVTTRIGEWRDPRLLKYPVDSDFLLRAAHAGLRFASTREVTAHKFAAGYRYLSYLRPDCEEQKAFLRILTTPPGVDIDGIVGKARRNGQYMTLQYGDYSSLSEGYIFEQNRKRKGIARPALRPLLNREVIDQTDDPRGSDWHELETLEGKRFRWSGPNPRPKILIPYSGRGARLSIEVICQNPNVPIEQLSLDIDGHLAGSKINIDAAGARRIVADITLRPADYTVITLNAPTFCSVADPRKLGTALGSIVIEPN